MSAKNFAERLDKATDMLMASGLFPVRQDVARAANAYYNMLLMAENYKPSSLYRGDISLVRARSNTVESGSLDYSYRLQEVGSHNQHFSELKMSDLFFFFT